MIRLRSAITLMFGMAVLASPAQATFPGANGKIAFRGCVPHEICTMNPDGTGKTGITSFGPTGPGASFPAWSADGRKIAFDLCPPGQSCGVGASQVNIMNADGTGIVNKGVAGTRPAWSPDSTRLAIEQTGSQGDDISVMEVFGSGVNRISLGGRQLWPEFRPGGVAKIAFAGEQSGFFHIYTMNPDGTNVVQVTGQDPRQFESDVQPSWSPDGAKIAFSGTDGEGIDSQVFVVNADGTGLTKLTNDPDFNNLDPLWSPDGTKIAFLHSDLFAQGDPADGFYVMNADGTDRILISATGGIDSWQPIVNAYPRPKGATPMRPSLVPAYKPCSSPDSTHGAPLSFSSCTEPVQASEFLTVGTPPQDPANSVGSVSARVTPGDVQLAVSVTDVRIQGSLADYTGELETRLPLRITDKDSTVAATTQDGSFSFAAPCASSVDPNTGSTCSTVTTANTILPGAASAGLRAIWQFGEIGVYDGGPDASASTTTGNTLFMTQGVFVP